MQIKSFFSCREKEAKTIKSLLRSSSVGEKLTLKIAPTVFGKTAFNILPWHYNFVNTDLKNFKTIDKLEFFMYL